MSTWLVPLLAAALGAGLLTLLERGVKSAIARRRASLPEVKAQRQIHDAVAAADQSIAVVARARDELAEDNRLLRAQNMADRQRYDRDRDDWRFDRAQWDAERTEMRNELKRMEATLRTSLAELEGLKAKYGIT